MKIICLSIVFLWCISVVAQENDSGLTPLMQAVIDLDIEVVRFLIAFGAAVNDIDSQGQTALMKVPYQPLYQKDFGAMFQLLLKAGGDITIRDNQGRTPLMVAALHCRSWLVEMYVVAGAEVNDIDSRGYTPLMLAMDIERLCYTDEYREVVRYLLAHGAEVDVYSAEGLTPLMQAANLSWLEAVKDMLAKGTDVNAQTRGGSSALSLATTPYVHPLNLDVRVIQYLLDQGADPTTDAVAEALLEVADFPVYDLAIVALLAKAGANINYWPSKYSQYPGQTFPILISAVKRRDADLVALLIEQGANLEIRDDSGRTPLLWAGMSFNKCPFEYQPQSSEMISLLVKGGADVNVRATPPDDWKDYCESPDSMVDTPLLQAAKRGDVKVVKLLVDAGADIKIRDSQGWTALDFAVQTEQKEIIEVLLEASQQ